MAKILVAEDDNIIRSAYITKLTMEGYEVFEASNGEEALEIANKEEPDIVLLDVVMPKMSGIEFLKEFDVKTKHPNTKVIVFSNRADKETPEEAIKLGAVKFLPKATYTPNDITNLIKDLLEK